MDCGVYTSKVDRTNEGSKPKPSISEKITALSVLEELGELNLPARIWWVPWPWFCIRGSELVAAARKLASCGGGRRLSLVRSEGCGAHCWPPCTLSFCLLSQQCWSHSLVDHFASQWKYSADRSCGTQLVIPWAHFTRPISSTCLFPRWLCHQSFSLSSLGSFGVKFVATAPQAVFPQPKLCGYIVGAPPAGRKFPLYCLFRGHPLGWICS